MSDYSNVSFDELAQWYENEVELNQKLELEVKKCQWISIADVELELHANYWVKTIDGSVLREVALYDGSSFTNGRWPVAISLISEVIKLTPPAAE